MDEVADRNTFSHGESEVVDDETGHLVGLEEANTVLAREVILAGEEILNTRGLGEEERETIEKTATQYYIAEK